MDELLFPMFSRFKREMNTNSFNDNLLDDEFLQVFDVSTRDDSQQYESIIDCNLKYFLPDIPKTCEWSLPVHSDDWVISYPSIGKAFFKLFFLENDLYVGMVAHRYFDVVFTCPDCKLIHRKTSAVRELLYRFGFQYMERKTATGYESFPDELAYMSNPNEVLQTKNDWTIENEIIKMLDEDIKKEDERVSSPSQDESNEEEVTEDSSHSTETTEDQTDPWNVDSKILCLEFLIHCMRFYTLLDHMDFFYGETTKSTEEMKTTLSENIAREEFTSEVCNTLINFSN